MPHLLEGRGVGRVFGQGALATRALHPSDLTIDAGEIVVLAGPSGSGKTTLLSILGLVLSPTEGEVRLRGEVVSGRSHDELARLRRRSLGFVFQQFNLLPGLSAADNVAIPLQLERVAPRRRRALALDALDRVGLAERAHHHPRQLSGGEQQRVALARAMVAAPDLVLCDEPTASLDAAAGGRVLDLLQGIARAAERAVLIVTHDPRVFRIADRVVEVADGRISRGALA